MKTKLRIGGIPNGATPKVGTSVAVRKISDGTTLTTLLSDAAGFVDLQANGHYEPYYLHLTGIPGGDKFWRSDDVVTAGVLPLAELPAALRALGDGVTRGYGSELAVSLVSNGPSLSVASGAALVAGHPFVVYSSVGLGNERPVSGVRIDRVIIRLSPTGSATTPGKADVVLLQGAVDAGVPPALTQNATVYELSLAQVSVPAAGEVTVADERAYLGEKLTVRGTARVSSASTTNTSGEALAGASVTLILPRTGTYDVNASLSGMQTDTAVVTGAWTVQGTYGSLGSGTAPNFNTPHQVAVNSTGKLYVADYANNRVVILNSDGTYYGAGTGFTNVIGVAVDASDNVYVSWVSGGTGQLYKYSSLFASLLGTYLYATFRHLATDGTHVWGTRPSTNTFIKIRCSDMVGVAGYGGTGSGNGQFLYPNGIATDGTYLYITDYTLNRVQKFTLAGVYVAQWGGTGGNNGQFSGPQGVAVDASGDVWVADQLNSRLQQFTNAGVYLQSIAQASPHGIDLTSTDVLWVSNQAGHSVAKWDEATTPGGHGQVAIEIDGVLSSYTGPGNIDCAVGNASLGTKAGPGTCVVRAFAKATANTMTLRGLVLSARAVPRA